jgi:hypothetical protein
MQSKRSKRLQSKRSKQRKQRGGLPTPPAALVTTRNDPYSPPILITQENALEIDKPTFLP